MKRFVAAIWTLIAIFLAILILADISNNKMIEKYNNGIYEQNPLGFLGFMEPYVNPYNRGNIYYSLGQYDLAEHEYEQAMRSELEERQDCRLRVNYALSMVEQIDPNAITEENLDDVLAILDAARDVLCENGCASRDDNSGHYPDAQTLKNEIDEFEQSLLEQFGQEPDPTPTPGEGEDPTPTPTPEGGETPTPTPGEGETPTPTPGEGEEPTPTPDGGDGDTPTPTPGGSGDGPTPTPEYGEPGDGTPTPTPGDGGQGGATPTPTMTPEEEILYIQGLGQAERYDGANGTPDDTSTAYGNNGTPW